MAMVSVKQGTRTWSPSAQTTSAKPETVQNLSAGDKARALGNENIGDVLNKVADPNYVDPAKTRKVGNNQLDKDAFLKLMLAQMKHQDPTKPMESHEMAAQLAQFTSLEQLNNINMTLESMKNSQAPTAGYQALNFIGKRVTGDSSKITRSAGDTNHDVNFQLMGDAVKIKVSIKDADGKTVKVLERGMLKKGENSVRWNGLSEDGMASRPGEYKVTVEGSNPTGGKVFAKTEFDGKITGVNFTGQGPVLLVGTQTIKLQDVKKIVEEAAPGADPTASAAAAIAESKSAATSTALAMMGTAAGRAAYPAPPPPPPPVDENLPAAEEPPNQGNIMNDVAMSHEVMDKLSNPK